MMTTLTIIHSTVSVLLIAIVLLQFGKGAEAGLFSDAGSSSVFSRKGDIMTRITSLLAIIFLSLSLGLAALRGKHSATSIFDKEPVTAAPLSDDAPVESSPAIETSNPETPKQ